MKWRGKLDLKTEEESCLTVLYCRQPNKVSCKNHSNTPGISMHTFLKDSKWKQKWTTFAMIHRLACQQNTLPCALSILKHRVSAEVCLMEHQWISRGFTFRKVQYHQNARSRKIHWTLITQEMREDLQIDFFPRNVLWTFLWDPTDKRQYPKSPSKKIDIFWDWVGLFEIYFRSSKMTDPRPCPTGWAYFRALSRSTKTCQAQTNNKLSTAKIDIS